MSDIDRTDLSIEAEQELRVIRNLAEATGDPPGLGGAVGVRLKLSSLGPWGLLLLSCRTIADVIRVGPQYYELSENFLHPSVESRSHDKVLVYADDEVPDDVRDFIIERDLAYNVTSVQSMVGTSMSLRLAVCLPCDRIDALAALLPGFTIEGGDRNTIDLPRAVLEQRLISGDRETHQRCASRCDELVNFIHRRDSVANRVRGVLLRSELPLPGLDRVAQEFHVDARTLRRWLVEDATSYRTLADEVCALRATELLQTPGTTVHQVARRLGYATAASFTRAFRRWTGETPAEWSGRRADDIPVRFGDGSVRTS